MSGSYVWRTEVRMTKSGRLGDFDVSDFALLRGVYIVTQQTSLTVQST